MIDRHETQFYLLINQVSFQTDQREWFYDVPAHTCVCLKKIFVLHSDTT